MTDTADRALPDTPTVPAQPAPGVAHDSRPEQLRKTCPEIHLEVTRGEPVVAVVDHSLTSLDGVLDAARQAARLGVPLELRFAEELAGPARAHLYQRLDLAVELARAVEPGVPVQLPSSNRASAD
jgi:hypothetical protein